MHTVHKLFFFFFDFAIHHTWMCVCLCVLSIYTRWHFLFTLFVSVCFLIFLSILPSSPFLKLSCYSCIYQKMAGVSRLALSVFGKQRAEHVFVTVIFLHTDIEVKNAVLVNIEKKRNYFKEFCLSLLLSVSYNFCLFFLFRFFFFLFTISLLYWRGFPPTKNIIWHFRCFYPHFFFILFSFIYQFEFIRLIQRYLHKFF